MIGRSAFYHVSIDFIDFLNCYECRKIFEKERNNAVARAVFLVFSVGKRLKIVESNFRNDW